MDLFGEPANEEPARANETSAAQAVADVSEQAETGFVHPRFMTVCEGFEDLEKSLLDAFQANKMAHGIILSGPKGIGKATFAFRLARFLLSQESGDPNQDALFNESLPENELENMGVDPESTIFKQVASGGHADFMVVERAYDSTKDVYKDNVGVDEVRKIIPFLRMTVSKEGGWRVVIVDDADTMSRNAQNAILKILEEPPAQTFIILVCNRLGAMIPTIRSRTQIFAIQPLVYERYTSMLSNNGYALSEEEYNIMYQLSEGSIGQTLEYIERGGVDILLQILGLLKDYPRWSWPDIHKFADQLARNSQDQSYKIFARLLPWVFAQMIFSKARGQAIKSKALQIEAIDNLQKQSSLETLLKICENLTSHFERTDRANLDKRQGVLGAFSIIAS